MKGQMKTGRRLITVVLASAALAFAQAGALSDPAEPTQVPYQGNQYANSTPQPPSAAVGPGTVNYVEGQVSLGDEALSQSSIGAITLAPGQSLTTANGYVELLLTPGAFLRVGHESEVRMVSAGLANTTVGLAHGSAMLEVDQLIKGTHLAVEMNGAATQIENKGLYSFDATRQAVSVLDGKARVAQGSHTQNLGKRNQVLLASDRPLKKRSFDEKAIENEPLYVWSKARSEDESRANEVAATDPTYYAAANTGWYWDPYAGYYGFWPAGGFLDSPFGWGFYSPLYFGYYGGGYGWYGHPGRSWHGHSGWRAGRVTGRTGAFHGSGGFHGFGGFHGGGGFHAAGGFHGGGGHR